MQIRIRISKINKTYIICWQAEIPVLVASLKKTVIKLDMQAKYTFCSEKSIDMLLGSRWTANEAIQAWLPSVFIFLIATLLVGDVYSAYIK